MSGTSRLFTDDAVDRVLDHWLSDGPTAMPDASFNAALRTVAVVPQRRWRGRMVRFTGASPLVPIGLTLGALAAVIALGIGINQALPIPGTEATPTPGYTDTPDASPDDSAPQGYAWYRNEEDGYELLVYGGWTVEYDEGQPGVAHFTEEQPDDSQPPLAISIGSRDGEVSLCALACFPEVVDSIDELEDAIQQKWPFGSFSERVESTTLGGEPARFRSATSPVHILHPHFVCVAYAFHDDRPVVVSYGCDAHPNGLAGMPEYATILESFRFLDSAPTPEGSQAPSGSGWRVVTDVPHGYALEVPAGWEDRECCSPGGRTFYAGEATPVTIMVGDADGTITICQRGDCAEVKATQMSDLRQAVQAVAPIDAASWRHTLRQDPLILGDEPAEREWPHSNFLAGPGLIYDWVYTIHDGQPIVLRFNHFRSKLNPTEQQRIIESFDFLD